MVFGWLSGLFNELKITDILLVFFTWVLADKTAGLFAETARMRKGVDDQKADTLRAVEAAEKAAKAAEAAVDHSRETAERQLRAYVWLKAVQLNDFLLGHIPVVILEVRNSGQTPAYDLEIGAGCFAMPYPLPPNTLFPPMNPGINPTKMVLHPGSEPPFNAPARFSYTPGNTLTEKQAKALATDKVRIYVFALVQYLDAFGKKRETRFCNWVDLTGPSAAFGYPDQHNEAT
jgi:hypothetical protein